MISIKDSQFADYTLQVNAPAKINLHLEILGFRSDGFHELAMVMQSIDLEDIILMKSRSDGALKLNSNDSNLLLGDQNLIIKAAKLLRSFSGNESLGADIYLQKNIPVGAGLAGGSSDAAATLLGLNSIWKLKYTKLELQNLCSKIGSDVPFCLDGGTQLCFGRGEKLEKVNCLKSDLAILLVKDPSVHISTPWAYQNFRELNSTTYLKYEEEFETRRDRLRDSKWLKRFNSNESFAIRNDLQNIVAKVTPSVQKSLEILLSMPGSISVSMSGSGPSCFVIYENMETALRIFNDSKMMIQKAGLESWCCKLIDHGVVTT